MTAKKERNATPFFWECFSLPASHYDIKKYWPSCLPAMQNYNIFYIILRKQFFSQRKITLEHFNK